ncbi:extracellular calcium-sensing receptor-like [Protopterus annectens]|uniref:extracellular calcium-sensing receptor-like n=1 Tax=Protopterus annectens TaxID=7888 RepID=UPI001CFA6752|nr:extracellular calcium-sensing receptor-like [Protopterus annectens]
MIFAVNEINQSRLLLPNITAGYRIFDTCDIPSEALRDALILLCALQDTSGVATAGFAPASSVIGDASSSASSVISRTLGIFHVPVVSYFASCACLSDRNQFPTFFRTMPSDKFQVIAIVNLVKKFQWTWIGVLGFDNDYGQFAIQLFLEEIINLGICVAFTEFLPVTDSAEKILQIVNTIKKSSASVILAFAGESGLAPLLRAMKHEDIKHMQWIASEAWATSTFLWNSGFQGILIGSLGFAIQRAEIKGLRDFLCSLHPSQHFTHPFIDELWEEVFNCTLRVNENITMQNISSLRRKCTGLESLEETVNVYSDVSQLRVSYNIYKAVYFIAHALHRLCDCRNDTGSLLMGFSKCVTSLQPWQLLSLMKKVSFTMSGEEISFDNNGDPVAFYDLINWQKNPDGSVKFMKTGDYDASLSVGEELTINTTMIKWHSSEQVPVSTCTNSCPAGARRATRENEPACCFDCIPCADGEIGNLTDSTDCMKCPTEYWSNYKRDLCVAMEVEFLSYSDFMGIALTAIAVLGTCFTLCIAVILFQFRSTPTVRANNMGLSFLLLLSLALCFLCVLLFIGKPTTWSCVIRQSVFGISFAFCISCILGKTVVVIMAFQAAFPGNTIIKWFGPAQQMASVFVCSSFQIIICLMWSSTVQPSPAKKIEPQRAKVILGCSKGSSVVFWSIFAFIGLLACMCFILAFLARKLPDTFNEAKFITFSMIVFFVVWITFIPAYISSPGKYTEVIEIFAILASTFSILFCIFSPKCYIILLKPAANSKKHATSIFIK